MWLIFVEATGAFFVFAFIVWWTMFSGCEPNTASSFTLFNSLGRPLAKGFNLDTSESMLGLYRKPWCVP